MYKYCTAGKPFVYFILGGPGSGKGTQCELLSKNLNYAHLSAGQLLRNAMEQNSEHKSLIESYINNGKIVPSFVTISLLEHAIFKNLQQNAFLIDGFPRNYENMKSWIDIMDSKIIFRSCIHIICSEDEMIKRIAKRSETSGRSDDNQEILKKRFITYKNDTKEIVDYYRQLNKLIEVNGDNSIETVQAELLEKLQNLQTDYVKKHIL